MTVNGLVPYSSHISLNPTPNTLLTLLCNPRGHVFLVTESAKGRRLAPNSCSCSKRARGSCGAGGEEWQRDGASAVDPQRRVTSLYFRNRQACVSLLLSWCYAFASFMFCTVLFREHLHLDFRALRETGQGARSFHRWDYLKAMGEACVGPPNVSVSQQEC